MNSYAFSCDTGGQSIFPISGDLRESDKSAEYTECLFDIFSLGRSLLFFTLQPALLGFGRFYSLATRADMGRILGRILRNIGGLGIAIVRYHGTNNADNRGGVYA